MKHCLINAYPLYNFLRYCENEELEKKVLDCGAGGTKPPLSLFYEFGYDTYGIEWSNSQIQKAKVFEEANDMKLQIIQGDMCDMPYSESSYGYLYSYNTSVHMPKKAFRTAISEFSRVMVSGGLCYMNFLTKECDTYGVGEEMESGEFRVIEDGEDIYFCHYDHDELETLLDGFQVIYKEERIIERVIDHINYRSSFMDYILKKL